MNQLDEENQDHGKDDGGISRKEEQESADESADDQKKEGSSDEEEEEDEEEESSDEEEEEEDQEHKRKRPSDVAEGKTVFIRNLSFDSTGESLGQFCEQFGPIEYCKIVVNPETGHSHGTAFVKFKSTESAEKCLVEACKEGSSEGGNYFVIVYETSLAVL